LKEKDLTFPRSLRLLTKQDYRFVFDDANKLGSHAITLLYRKNEKKHARLGVIVSKKILAKAVMRNRFKRRIRESFRQYQHHFPGIDIVILSKPGAKKLNSAALQKNVERVWRPLYPSSNKD
jgi:ribonuclease P protein component